MARLLNLSKDKKNRNKFLEKIHRNTELQLLLLPKKVKKSRKLKYLNAQKELKKKFQILHIKNMCILTGVSRSIYKKFSLSRHTLRVKMNNGFLPMLSQSSW